MPRQQSSASITQSPPPRRREAKEFVVQIDDDNCGGKEESVRVLCPDPCGEIGGDDQLVPDPSPRMCQRGRKTVVAVSSERGARVRSWSICSALRHHYLLFIVVGY